MFDFRPDEEQTMLVGAINRFATEKIHKGFREADERGVIPADLIQMGWEIGLTAAAIPETWGGLGEYSVVTGGLAVEAFAFGDLATALQIMLPNLVAIPLLLCGSEAQKATYLPDFTLATPPNVTAALTERVYQFDPRHLGTMAERQDETYILTGQKVYVPLANQAENMLVWANEDGITQGFLLPTNTPGISLGPQDKLMGFKGLPTFEVKLDQVIIPASDRLGEAEGCDFDLLLNHSRVALGAAAVGMAKAAYEYARDYSKQRVQFGKPIAQNQSIAFMLADMLSDVESMRMLVWEAAWLLDQGREATQAVTVLKHYVDQAVLRVADSAVQILGGYGYIREFPVELYLRNARGFAASDGLMMI